MFMPLLFAILMAMVASTVITRCIAAYGPLQRPNARSSHVRPTPQSGGLGIVAGVGLAFIVLGLFQDAFGSALGNRTDAISGCLVFLCLVGLIGTIDDIWDLGAGAKLAILTALSVALAANTGGVSSLPLPGDSAIALPLIVGVLGAALFVFTTANAANFIDGANGLLAGSMAIAFVALAICSALAGATASLLLSLIGLASTVGFLPFNAKAKAQVFLGDVGALFLGALFASAALFLIPEAPAGSVYLIPVMIAPILTDVLLTQLDRLQRGESLLKPHRDHAYQRRIVAGSDHITVSRGMWLQSVGCCALAVIGASLLPTLGPSIALMMFLLAFGACALVRSDAPFPVEAAASTAEAAGTPLSGAAPVAPPSTAGSAKQG